MDGDGRLDLGVTNYSFESHTLYLQGDDLFFEDRSVQAGLESSSYLQVGLGHAILRCRQRRDLDLAVANGHVLDNIDMLETGIGYPQPNQLWLNRGRATFEDASASAGAPWTTPKVSRGLAVGDWNDDGRLDLLVTHTNERPDLLENRLETGTTGSAFGWSGPPGRVFASGPG